MDSFHSHTYNQEVSFLALIVFCPAFYIVDVIVKEPPVIEKEPPPMTDTTPVATGSQPNVYYP